MASAVSSGFGILIVEDHPAMREMLTRAVARIQGVAVNNAVGSAEEALEELETKTHDLLLVDISLPAMNGLDLVELLSTRDPPVACLIVSGHPAAQYAKRALQVGAKGYVVKSQPKCLKEAVTCVMEGGTYFVNNYSRTTR